MTSDNAAELLPCEWWVPPPEAMLDRDACYRCGSPFNAHPKSVTRNIELQPTTRAPDAEVSQESWRYQEESDVYTHIVRAGDRFLFQLAQDTSGEAEANARLIVQAVNSHQALVTAARTALDFILNDNPAGLMREGEIARDGLRAALKLAGE